MHSTTLAWASDDFQKSQKYVISKMRTKSTISKNASVCVEKKVEQWNFRFIIFFYFHDLFFHISKDLRRGTQNEKFYCPAIGQQNRMQNLVKKLP